MDGTITLYVIMINSTYSVSLGVIITPERYLAACSRRYLSKSHHYPGWYMGNPLTAPLFLFASRPRAAVPQERRLQRRQWKRPGDHFNHTLLQASHSAMSGNSAGPERHPARGWYSPQNFLILFFLKIKMSSAASVDAFSLSNYSFMCAITVSVTSREERDDVG